MANLKNFFNEISQNNKIFTAEDIGEMSTKEFSKNEKAINYQMENLGVPRHADLVDNSDVVFVHAYTRDDGTEVKAHFRSKPDGIRNSNMNETPTGFASNAQPTMIEGGVSYTDFQRSTIDDYSPIVENATMPLVNKVILQVGINTIGNIQNQNDAVKFWNIAANSSGVKNNNYIKKNGKIYNSIKDLDNEYSKYKNKITEKVNSQFHKNDVPGIIFHENSSVSKSIANSQELMDFVTQNAHALYSGKEVTGSWNFTSDKNLHNAFGKIEVLSAKLKNKDIEFILLDTYDFNPNESNWKVQMGYKVQHAGLLNPYYTIVKCKYRI